MIMLLLLFFICSLAAENSCFIVPSGEFGAPCTLRFASDSDAKNATSITYSISARSGVTCQARGISCMQKEKRCFTGWHNVSEKKTTLAWRSNIGEVPSIRCKAEFDSEIVWTATYGSKHPVLASNLLEKIADDTGGTCAGSYVGGTCTACDVGCDPPTLPGCNNIYVCGQGAICCPVGKQANCWCEYVGKPNAVKCACT